MSGPLLPPPPLPPTRTHTPPPPLLYTIAYDTVILVSGQSNSGRSTVYPQNQTVLNGSSVTFPCVIPGANTTIWRDENNLQILNDARITVDESELRINPVSYSSDQHGYYCVGLANGVEISSSRSPTVYLNILCELSWIMPLLYPIVCI